jgi:hypothetical protein
MAMLVSNLARLRNWQEVFSKDWHDFILSHSISSLNVETKFGSEVELSN